MEWWQILLLTLYGAYAVLDGLGPAFFLVKPVVAGMFAGLIMGDLPTGLFIGGTLQLMVLGVGNYGGSSMPDYMSGALLGTAFAVTSGSQEIGLAVAVPVGVLLVQLDILARFCNTYFQHMADRACEARNWKLVQAGNLLGAIPFALSRAIPLFLCLVVGQDLVAGLAAAAPDWLLNGFKLVSGMLPAVGIAILLRYMPFKRYWMFALLGFVLVAYLKVPVLGCALIGLVAAAIMYAQFVEKQKAPVAVAAAAPVEGGIIDDDE